MADNWEPVGQSSAPSSDGWEAVGTTRGDGFNDPVLKAKQQVMQDEIVDRLKAAGGGLEAAVDMIGGIPSFIGGGLLGLLDPRHGGDMAKAGEQVRRYQDMIPKPSPHSHYGKVAMEAVDALRSKTGDLAAMGPKIPIPESAMRTLDEAAFDIGSMTLPTKVSRAPLSEAARAHVEAMSAIENSRRQAPPPEVKPNVEPGIQGDLPLEGGSTSPLAEPSSRVGPDSYEMMNNFNEKMDVARRQANGPQMDMFDPTPSPESVPGIERSRILRDEELKQKGTIPYEDARVDEGLTERMYDKWRDNTRTIDIRGDFPSVDFPLGPEKVRRDPYLQTLFEEATKAYNENQRIHRWTKAHGWTRNTLAAAHEAAKRVAEVTQLAEEYAREGLNISKVEGYTGSMWGDKPSRTIVKSGERDVTTRGMSEVPGMDLPDTRANKVTQKYRIEKTPTFRPYVDNSTKRGRQRGAVDFWSKPEEKNARLKELEDLISKNQKRIEGLEKLRESGTYADTVDSRLEKLYYEQMRYRNEQLRLTDKDHPLNKVKKLNPKHPGFKQRGTVDFSGDKKPTDKELERARQAARLNPKGFEWGGFDALPTRLKDWIYNLAESKAYDQVIEEYGLDQNVSMNEILNEGALKDALRRHIEDAIANRDFVKQAINLSGGPNFTRGLTPPYELGSPGTLGVDNTTPRGRQKGTISLDNDPEFKKFKNELPLPMKKDAKRLYKLYKKQLDQRPTQIYENESGLTTMDDIPGLRDWKDEVSPITKPVAEVKADILKEADIPDDKLNLGLVKLPTSRLGRQLVSGGKLYGFGTQNTLIRYTVQHLDNAIRRAYRSIGDLILDTDKGFKPKWEKLSKEEFGEAWALLQLNEGKADLTRDQMYEAGLNDKQADALESLRGALDQVYHQLNEARAAVGKKPFERRLGYIPSRFRGDFIIDVRDAAGELVHRIGTQSLKEAENARKVMEKAHPEFTFSETRHEPLHRFKDASDAQAGYQALLEVLAEEDPRVEALESTYNDYLKDQAYTMLGVKKHFLNKKGVGGSEGFKEWKDVTENAHEGLRSVMNYMDHALKWAEWQKVRKDIADIFADREVQEKQKNALQYAQAYIDQALGRSTKLARHLDAILDLISQGTGVGQSKMLSTIRDVKGALTAYYLGFMNAGFSMSQMVQVLQTVPSWQLMLKNKGADASVFKSWALGALDSSIGFGVGREKMSPLAQGAWEYAKEYGIVEPKILDEVRSWNDRSINKALKFVSTWNMTAFEKFARTQAYFSWVHFLHDTGRFTPGRELYETAANLTDMTMVDYRNHERPMLYKQLGIVEESANALTTFKHNYYSQAWALSQHATPRLIGDKVSPAGGWGPVGVFLATLFALSGALGLPGREELDGLIHFLNMGSPYRIPTSREIIMRAPDIVSFGAASEITGADISGKFSAANILPDSPMQGLFPFASTLGNIGGAFINSLMDPSTTNFARLGYQLSPQSIKAVAEDNYFSDSTPGKDKMILNPDTLEGKFRRDKASSVYRYLGLRSESESRQMHDSITLKEQDAFEQHKRQGIISSGRDALFAMPSGAERNAKLQALARKFAEHEGDIDEFISRLEENAQNRKLTLRERELLNSVNNPAKAKRILGR